MRTLICTVAAAAATTALAAQVDVPITNHSFEDPILGNGAVTSDIPGWRVVGEAGAWNPSLNAYTGGYDGSNVAWSNGGALQQDTGELLRAGATYVLQIDVGFRANAPGSPYTITLRAGAETLAVSRTPGIPARGTFSTATITHTVGPDDPIGEPISIRFSSDRPQTNFDNVRLRYTICEADRDADGDADVQDLLAFLSAFRGGDADHDGNGATEVADLLAFLAAFRTGC